MKPKKRQQLCAQRNQRHPKSSTTSIRGEALFCTECKQLAVERLRGSSSSEQRRSVSKTTDLGSTETLMSQGGEGYIVHVSVKAISIDELPKARSRKTSPIKKTKDWKETLERIAAMDFELLRVDFSPETVSLGTSVPDRFKRMLAAEIKTLGLDSKLRLTFRGVTTGNPILYIVRRDKQMKLFSSIPSKRRRQQTAEPPVALEKNTRRKMTSRSSRSE